MKIKWHNRIVGSEYALIVLGIEKHFILENIEVSPLSGDICYIFVSKNKYDADAECVFLVEGKDDALVTGIQLVKKAKKLTKFKVKQRVYVDLPETKEEDPDSFYGIVTGIKLIEQGEGVVYTVTDDEGDCALDVETKYMSPLPSDKIAAKAR